MDEATFEAEGWTRLPTIAFSENLGAAWVKGPSGQRTVAIMAQERIVNDYGVVVHGGALMTFADIALGCGASDALEGKPLVTAQLAYQFAGGVQMGQLITCEPEIVRKTSSLVFMRGLIKADGSVVGSVDGIFKALTPREG
ncbi:PaaI family thioesterase [Novosphingobium sp. G106]|uniref:PaaI family thioesterase n=1 Tax=Novosphingobium sp. G106 TaxID=2849500 RepID=UPI001C2CE9A6|nr:PaaI family thioesterase [Novosphingobium sp. G106]MBV1687521.1 PaaI family thioesterase [Novosphingobium sp. G106]